MREQDVAPDHQECLKWWWCDCYHKMAIATSFYNNKNLCQWLGWTRQCNKEEEITEKQDSFPNQVKEGTRRVQATTGWTSCQVVVCMHIGAPLAASLPPQIWQSATTPLLILVSSFQPDNFRIFLSLSIYQRRQIQPHLYQESTCTRIHPPWAESTAKNPAIHPPWAVTGAVWPRIKKPSSWMLVFTLNQAFYGGWVDRLDIIGLLFAPAYIYIV